MSNTLDWVGDGDDLAVVERLEQTFEISFSKEELTALTDVGSLHDLVLQKLSRINDKGKCASAMAFYRLRSALKSWRNDIAILPSTAMKVFPTSSPKYLFRSLERQTGLRLGYQPHSWIGILGGLLVVTPIAAFLPALAWGDWVQPLPSATGAVMTGMFFFGIILLWSDPRRLAGSVGDLARRAARENLGRLMKQGAHGGDDEIWAIFTAILAEESRLKSEEIRRETVFFRSQLAA